MKSNIATFIFILISLKCISQECMNIEVKLFEYYNFYDSSTKKYNGESCYDKISIQFRPDTIIGEYSTSIEMTGIKDTFNRINFSYDFRSKKDAIEKLIQNIELSKSKVKNIPFERFEYEPDEKNNYNLTKIEKDTANNISILNISPSSFDYYNKEFLKHDIVSKMDNYFFLNNQNKEDLIAKLEIDSVNMYLTNNLLSERNMFRISKHGYIEVKWKDCIDIEWNTLTKMFPFSDNPSWEGERNTEDKYYTVINPKIETNLIYVLPNIFRRRNEIKEFYNKRMAVLMILSELENLASIKE